jgi:hypothetical protein
MAPGMPESMCTRRYVHEHFLHVLEPSDRPPKGRPPLGMRKRQGGRNVETGHEGGGRGALLYHSFA